MNAPQTANDDGRCVAYAPGVAGWVVAVWSAPPRKPTPRMQEEIFFFWHGPDAVGSASHLQSAVAVFPSRAAALEAFETTFAEASTHQHWEPMSVAEAEHEWEVQGIKSGQFHFVMAKVVHGTEHPPNPLRPQGLLGPVADNQPPGTWV
jgi:hypothetical protein